MISKILAAVFILPLFCLSMMQAQQTETVIENVILFNENPHLVQMTKKGKILAFVKEVDKDQSSLNSVKSRLLTMTDAEVFAAIDLARQNGNKLDPVALAELRAANLKQISEEQVGVLPAKADTPMALVEETQVEDTQAEDMTAKGKETLQSSANTSMKYDYEFAFDHRDASLSQSSVNQLNQIAKILSSSPDSNVEIRSYFSDSVAISKLLSKNRAKAIHSNLVSNGIQNTRIQIIEANNEDWANNKVKVAIK